jgi:hypothetical protein
MEKYQHQGSIVFNAHPACHGIRWEVQDTVANKHVLLSLKNQRMKGEGARLDNAIAGLQNAGHASKWQAAAMDQTPNQVWGHRNELTAYQVWVAYRLAMRQLNLYHEGRERDNSCRKVGECAGVKETVEHIFWECRCAQQC